MLKSPCVSKLGGSTCALAAALSLAAAVAPTSAQVVAQTTTGEVTVTARYPAAGADVRSLSAPVSYSDLDLTTASGRDTLQKRVSATAHELCRRLGEPAYVPPAPPCAQAAADSARDQMRMAIAQATPKGYAVNPPSASASGSPAAETSPAPPPRP